MLFVWSFVNYRKGMGSVRFLGANEGFSWNERREALIMGMTEAIYK